MMDAAEYVAHYLDQYRNDEDAENAWHNLTDVSEEGVPHLVAAYRSESDIEIRHFIVDVIGEMRMPQGLEFLTECLNGSEPRIWKQALNGIVLLGLAEEVHAGTVRETLLTSRSKAPVKDKHEKAEWIQEALEQVNEHWAQNRDKDVDHEDGEYRGHC